MMRFVFARVLMVVTLFCFLTFPLLCVAAIYRSKVVLIAAVTWALLIQIWFKVTAFSRVLELKSAHEVTDEGAISQTLNRIYQSVPHSKIRARFFVFPQTEAKIEFWTSGRNRIVLLMSQGALSIWTEAELTARIEQCIVLQKNSRTRYAAVLQQEALGVHQRLNRLRGRMNTFRYWFTSFWLLPIEKALNYASHLL